MLKQYVTFKHVFNSAEYNKDYQSTNEMSSSRSPKQEKAFTLCYTHEYYTD